MTRKIKVLQLQNHYNVNASDLAEQIIKGLPADRYEVTTVFLRGKPGPEDPVSCANHSVYFDLKQGDTKGLRVRALVSLYKHCNTEQYDTVIAHRFKPINMMMLLNRWLRLPACIGVLHGLGEYDRAYRRWAQSLLISPAWRLVGVSRAVYRDLIDSCPGLTPATIRQINNAIDIKKAEELQLPRADACALLGLPSDKFIFGTIGRLVPVKGHIDLLEAFALISNKFPEVMLAIIGEGRLRNELQAAIRRLGIEKQALLLGAKDDALQYVKAFDCFVMPSHSEGLPLALLEAMSGKVPVIGSNIDSLRPILEDCGGRIFSVGHPQELAKQLEEVLNLSKEQRTNEGIRAYAYLCKAHSIELFRGQYRELLDEMLEAQGPQ